MKQHFSPPVSPDSRGIRVYTVGLLAVLFTFVGIVIASNLDLSPKTHAVSEAILLPMAAVPVVERDGVIESPFVSVVEKVKDAVVNISARSRSSDRPWWHRGPNYETSSGSGFFFRSDGYILTNNHVVQGAEKLTVRTSSGYEYAARLVGSDRETDLAVLKVELEQEVTIIPFGNSDDIRVGDWAIAIGNPFPQQGLDRTVTVGVISAKGRSNLNFGRETPSFQSYIQTDASINPGNSGGPLLNLRGECVGINAAISSPTGSSVGIGFAIPINLARAIVPDLIATGKASRGWLGIYLRDVSEREAKRQGLDAVKGVIVEAVYKGSPAEKAGILSGDIIVGFNDRPVENSDQFRVAVSTVKGGSDVPIEITRDGKNMVLMTRLADRDTFLAGTVRPQEPNLSPEGFAVVDWMGMEIMEFTPEIAKIIGADYVEGLYVRRVRSGSPADNSSISRGTVILQVNKTTVGTLDDLRGIASSITNKKMRIPLMVQEPDGNIARKVIKQFEN